MKTTQHTSLPWKYDDTWALINGPKGQEISAIHAHETKYDDRVTRNEAQANAAFIVRACNAHYGMLEALKYVLNCQKLDCSECADRLRAAIAQAEGKE